MNIACLGWGSLVWDPRDLPIRRPWFVDGPMLPIEFTRRSSNGRITLVITPNVALVRSLWALFSLDDVDNARTRLGEREGVPKDLVMQRIAVWRGGEERDPTCARIAQWARAKNLDTVLWTRLEPEMESVNGPPTLNDVIKYLKGLQCQHEKYLNAEHYIRMAPRQIDTEYRRAIEREFGWTCLSEI